MDEIIWDFVIKTDWLIRAKWLDLWTINRTKREPAVSVNYQVIIKESEKKNKKKKNPTNKQTVAHEVDSDTS